MNNNITIKKVLDEEGNFNHVELHQNGNVIRVSFRSTQVDSKLHTYKWDNLKQVIDKLRDDENSRG